MNRLNRLIIGYLRNTIKLDGLDYATRSLMIKRIRYGYQQYLNIEAGKVHYQNMLDFEQEIIDIIKQHKSDYKIQKFIK